MDTAKSYIESRQLLFKRLIQVALFTCLLAIILNIIFKSFSELVISVPFALLLISIWYVFKYFSKTLAYHFMLWCLLILLGYPIFIQGNSYYAIIIYPVAALVYNFIFFDDKKVLWFYFVFLAVLEFFLLSSTMRISFSDIPDQFFAEYLNTLAYMGSLFFIGRFFITNLRKHQNELAVAKEDIQDKRAELIEKNNTLDKYIESNIQLESFAQMAAHELKAPLSNISAFAGILKKEVKNKLNPVENEMLETMNSSTRKMHNLVGALNQLGSVSKMELQPENFLTNELIDEILFDRKIDIERKNAMIKKPTVETHIFGDRTLLKQLISNLVGNAIKFVKKDIVPEIEIKIKKSADQVLFKISDNGIGIADEDKDSIFILFERLHNSSEYSGSGIGLAICKKIVDLHQGEIWVESNQEGGSVFCFKIPQ